MNVIFLDVDGVLNNEYTTDRIKGYVGIDDNKVRLLKQIVDYFDAKIVLSSTWRHDIDNEIGAYLFDKLSKQGLFIYDYTPNISWTYRAKEVATWINDNHNLINSVIILDDEDFNWEYYQLDNYWVRTLYNDENGGLTETTVNNIINYKERFVYKGE